MNLYTKQKQTHRPTKQTYGKQKGKGGGEAGQIRGMGLTDTNNYALNTYATRIYHITQGTIFNIL